MSLSPSGAQLLQMVISPPMPSYVVDSSVVLAILANENGAIYASPRIERAIISAVNLVEIVTKLVDWGYEAAVIEALLYQLSLSVVHFGEPQALSAGALRTQTCVKGLSLGDRACLALAQTTGRIALTADRAWADLDIGVQIEVIR
jgi:ribonuclease VapC